MSASEVSQLKACVGGMIAMTSFVSTTKNPVVAEGFSGNGEHRPDVESVIFEITIDESGPKYERSPFADISSFSVNEDEVEVLLCLGTTLRVDSVETKGQRTWVRVRMCERAESEALRQIKTEVNQSLPKGSECTDQIALFRLAHMLISMNDYRRKGQIVKILQSPRMSPMNPLMATIVELFSIAATGAEINIIDPDLPRRFLAFVDRCKQLTQSLIDSESLDRGLRDHCIAYQPFLDAFTHAIESGGDLSHFPKAVQGCDESLKKLSKLKSCGDLDMVRDKFMKPVIELIAGQDPTFDQGTQPIAKAYIDKVFSEKDPQRILLCLHMADEAYKKGDSDQAIRSLREGLTTPTYTLFHFALYRKLIEIYNKQRNWPAAIECYHDIINMPQLPPNSPEIVQAYINCGLTCRLLGDYAEELLNYTKALELQHQHHPPRHPRTAEVHLQLGIVFSRIGDTVAAMDHFQSTISLDFPESTSEAHKWLTRLSRRVKH